MKIKSALRGSEKNSIIYYLKYYLQKYISQATVYTILLEIFL